MSSEPSHATWFALFGPPLAWFVALNAAYFMTGWACGAGVGRPTQALVLLLSLAVSAAALISGIREWRRSGREWPGTAAVPAARTRLIQVVGILEGVVFTAAILWFCVAVLLLNPCDPGPRLRFSPSAAVPSIPWAPEPTATDGSSV